MFFILFLIAFFVLLIAISIINLFLSFSIKMVTNNSIEEYKFIVPSILYLVISGLTFLTMYLLTINILELGITESIMAIIFKTVDISSKLNTIIIANVIIVVVSILIQSLCLMTINIDYTITLGRIRMFFKDIFKSIKNKLIKKEPNKTNTDNDTETSDVQKIDNEIIENINVENEEVSNLAAVIPEGEMAENKERAKLSIGNSLICTLFIFSFLFFTFMILFTVGSFLSSKIL